MSGSMIIPPFKKDGNNISPRGASPVPFLNGTKISALNVIIAQVLTSFTQNSGSHEYGETVDNVGLNWALNRNSDDPTSQTMNQGIGSVNVSLRALNLTEQAIVAPKTFTLDVVGDDGNPSSLTATVPFYWSSYWGSSADDVFSGADIMSILEPQHSALESGKHLTGTFNGGTPAKYYYYAYKASYGAIASWTMNGFNQPLENLEYSNGVDGFSGTPTAITLTNSNGRTVDVYLVRATLKYDTTGDILVFN